MTFANLAIRIHDKIEKRYGLMATGLRFLGDLDMVKNYKQAAKVILEDHPFFDGNKRTAIVLFALGTSYPGINIIYAYDREIDKIIETWDWLLRFLTRM